LRLFVAMLAALGAAAALATPAFGAARPGGNSLTAEQWAICEKYVLPPIDGLAEPCTEAQVTSAFADGKLPAEEFTAWLQQKNEAKERHAATYATPPDGAPSASSGSSASISASGSPDYLSDLGLSSPFCGGQGLTSSQQQNCVHSGSPWSSYPIGNYGLDINTGSNGGGILSLDVNGFVTGLLQELANGLWMFGLYVLKGAITLIELAFGLDLFGNPHAMSGISAALTNLYDNFDVPWMSGLLAAIGLWGIWTGLVQRRHSYTIGATLASIVMVVAAMWIIAQPSSTVGFAYESANKAALDLVAAPSQGSVGNPQGSFADAMSSLWTQMVRGPWCALDFTSIAFCEGKPEQAAVKQAAEDAYQDNSILLPELADALSPTGGNCDSAGEGATSCIQHYVEAHQPYPPPAIRADLYLRYSPGSKPRTDLWTYYHGTDEAHILIFGVGGGHAGHDPAAVSIQGTDGWITRIVLLLLLGLGLLGALLMLVWIAVRLALQTCTGLVLLMLAPIALLLPAFGEHGRATFARWASSLLGAMVGKAWYAAMLAAAVTGSAAIAGLARTGTSLGVSLVLLDAFWWAYFLQRNQILALVQAGPRNALADPERGHVAARAAAGYATVLAARYGLRQLGERRIGRRQASELHERAERQAVRRAAYDELAALESAKALNEIEPAKSDLAEREQLQADAAETQRQLDDLAAAEEGQAHGTDATPRTSLERLRMREALTARQREIGERLEENEPRFARAEQILARERRLGLGEDAITPRELEQRVEGLRARDSDPTSEQNLRSYAGITASEYAVRAPAEREALKRTIAAQIAREDSLLAAVPSAERGGITHAPLGAGESKARLALPPGAIDEHRQIELGQMEQRLGDRESERGANRGVIRRRVARRAQLRALDRRGARERALAEREARLGAERAQWRLDAERRRGRGRP
jgi:hypothetical protein